MGLALLLVFVGASLAFSLRAWVSYGEDPYKTSRGSGDDKDTPLVVA
jgi:hypothetical protein